jgi:hypothetical protein
MQNILISLKSKSKFHFLMELLSQFDFIEIRHPVAETKTNETSFFLKTAGLWKDRNFNVEKYVRDLRKGKRVSVSYEK